MRRERRDAALARQVVPERRESPDPLRSAHAVARCTVPVDGTDIDRSSSALLFSAGRLNPCALCDDRLTVALDPQYAAIEGATEPEQVLKDVWSDLLAW
jgi:hypothetical protein